MAPPAQNPARPRSSSGQLHLLRSRAVDRLASALGAAGWEVSRARADRSDRAHPKGADLVCRLGDRAYAVSLAASVGRVRRPHLRGLLADSLLRSRAQAEHRDVEPLAVLAAPSLSPAIVSELADYVRTYGAGASWGVLDERGLLELHGPDLRAVGLAQSERVAEPEPAYAGPLVRSPHNLYSDLGQWMLKVLLAHEIPEHLLNAPRQPARGVASFAEQAGVSAASASRFLASLRAAGHLAPVGQALRLLQPEALLAAWRNAANAPSAPSEERYARFLLPASDPDERLRQVLASHPSRKPPGAKNPPAGSSGPPGPPGSRCCLALFSACRALNAGFVRGAPLHIYAEDLSDRSLQQLQLHPVHHPAEADLIVRRPRFPESVFRASVLANDVPASDLLQCWLDVSSHPARGAEQASEIAQLLEVLNWAR